MGWHIWPGETTCGPFNQTLTVNQACLDVVSEFDVPLKFYTRNVECYKCNFALDGTPAQPNSTTSYIIDTSFGMESYFSHGPDTYCKMKYDFGDFGHYQLNISPNNCKDVKILKEPEKLWTNVGLSICIYVGLIALYWILKFIYTKCHLYLHSSNVSLRELEMDLGIPNNREERKVRLLRQSRVKSIDAFRGIAIILMIFVNYGGGEYSAFKHAPWTGLTVADLVFPWFVWIMGASIVLSLRYNLRTSTSRKMIFCHIITRTVLLISLGIILNSGKREKHNLRICGVLQRLGITYFVVASIEILVAKPQRNEQYGPWNYCTALVDSWMQWLLAICFTFAHELLTFLLPVPGCPTGYLGPGGLSEHSLHRNCTGGAAGYIDRLVFTESHMYQRGTFVKIYKPPVAYDPEGLLGTLTSILCAFLGAHAAQIILSMENPYARMRNWITWAILTGITAGFLCSWSENNGIIPINKNLWSLSYVLATSSIAYFILAVLYWLIDLTHVWNGFPLVYAGMNPITLYIGHSLLKDQLPFRWVPFTKTHFELLFMDITAVMVWLLIAFVLYKYKVFITL